MTHDSRIPEANAAAREVAPMAQALSRPSIRLLLAILVAITLLTYGNCLLNGFVWDDQNIIIKNPVNRDLANIPRVLFSADVVYADDTGFYYRPLNRLTYLLEFSLYGLQPAGYHLVNLLVHLANVLLLFALGQRLFGEPVAAFASALLLAVHPVATEAVNFISGRNNALATFFVLSSVLLFLRGSETRRNRFFILTGITFFAGLLTKEIALMTLPLLLLWSADTSGKEQVPLSLGQRCRALIPCGIAVLLYLALRAVAMPAVLGPATNSMDIWQRLAQNLYAVPVYISLILFPTDLKVYYDIPADYLSRWQVIAPVWLAGSAALYLLLRQRNRPVLFALLWLGLNYIPISHIVPFASAPIAERYIYLPAIGFWLLAGAGVAWIEARPQFRRLLVPGLTILAIGLAVPTWLRNREWRDDFSLFAAQVRTDPASAFGHYNLGAVYRERGELDLAREQWQITVAIDPRHSQAFSQLGSVALMQGRVLDAERYYTRALAVSRNNAEAHYNLAMVMARTGRPDEAIMHYEQFLQRVPPEYQEMVPAIEARIRELRSKPARQ